MSCSPRSIPAAIALAILATVIFYSPHSWADSAPASDDERYLVDDRGRPLRVVFPLHDRVTIDAYTTGTGHSPSGHVDIAGGLRLAIEHSFQKAYPDDEIWWRFRHRWLSLRAHRGSEGLHLGMTLLSATYIRHATNNYILIPSANHAQIRAPFDIAFEYDIFDATFDYGGRQLLSVNIAEFAFLLDFLRDSDYRHRLGLGPVMAYEIDGQAHSFIPASGGRLIYRWEDRPGRTAVDGRLQCAATAILIDRDLGWHRLCDAELSAERTFLAIADRPLNLFIEGVVRESPDRPELSPSMQWNATVGLRLSLPDNSPD